MSIMVGGCVCFVYLSNGIQGGPPLVIDGVMEPL